MKYSLISSDFIAESLSPLYLFNQVCLDWLTPYIFIFMWFLISSSTKSDSKTLSKSPLTQCNLPNVTVLKCECKRVKSAWRHNCMCILFRRLLEFILQLYEENEWRDLSVDDTCDVLKYSGFSILRRRTGLTLDKRNYLECSGRNNRWLIWYPFRRYLSPR